MKRRRQLIGFAAIAAVALTAGCGGGGGGSTTVTVSTPTATGSTPTTSTTSTTSTSTEAGQATPDDVYRACVNAVKGSVSDSTVQTACAQARDAFQQCLQGAQNAPEGTVRNQALRACQAAANKATAQLKSSGG